MNKVYHKGIIEEIKGRNALIRIVQHSACDTCKSAKRCGISEQREKIIMIPIGNIEVKRGEFVDVIATPSDGMKAIFYAFIIPLALIVVTLILSYIATSNEPLSALIAITILLPYYVLLYIFRKKLYEIFSFRIVKQKSLSYN